MAIIANPGLLLKAVEGSSSGDDSESSSSEDKDKSSSHLEPESLSGSVIDVDTNMDVDEKKVKGHVNAEEKYGDNEGTWKCTMRKRNKGN